MLNKRLLGIDWGSKRIGLAIGDMETKLALPYGIVQDINEIQNIVLEEDIDKLILGNPLKMRGIDETTSAEFNNFLKHLKVLNRPMELVDERLTSKQADKLVGDKKTKASRDAIAAQLILQAYLDALSEYKI